MLKKFRAIFPEDKEYMRVPRAASKAQIQMEFDRKKILNYRGEESKLLQELADTPEKWDLPF